MFLKRREMKFQIIAIFKNKLFSSVLIIIVLFLFGQMLRDGFASINNVGNMLTTSSMLMIAALGQAIVIIAGNSGIDLSIGASIGMGALLGPMIAGGTDSKLIFAAFALIMIGGIIGFLNGLGVQLLKIPSLVMTLAMAIVIDGFTLAITRGQPAILIPDVLLNVGRPIIGPLRWMVAIAVIFIVAMSFLLRRTRFGKLLLLVGSNRKAALHSGVHVNKVVIAAYMISSIFASLVGLFLVGYTGSAQLRMGEEYTLLSIGAVVIGGVKLSGGQGNFLGCAMGAIILILITNILVILGMPAGFRKIVYGGILLVILAINNREKSYRI